MDEKNDIEKEELDALLNEEASAADGAEEGAETGVDEQILSQNEIDALLAGVETGSVFEEEEVEEDEYYDDDEDVEIKPFRFATQDVLLQRRLPRLEVINDRFSKNLQDNLYNILQRRVMFTFDQVEMVRFNEYVSTLQEPISLHLAKIDTLHGIALFALEGAVIFGMIERLFGGKGGLAYKMGVREFTPMEIRIIDRFLSAVFVELSVAWEGVLDFKVDIICHEINPQLINIAGPSDVMVVNRFTFSIDDCSGEFHMVMPYAMLEPMRDDLDSGVHNEMTEVDEEWQNNMLKEIMQVKVGMSSVLAEASMKLDAVHNMKEGDVVALELPEHVTLFAENIPVFLGKFGVSNDKCALKIVDRFSCE